MFTGIIEATPKVLQKTATGLVVQRPEIFTDIAIGSSICVSGVCLSVIAFDDQSISFDVVEETWNCSSLGHLEQNKAVNVERSLSADGRYEGHVVQGHVEGVGVVTGKSVMGNGGDVTLEIELSDELIKNCVQKGSIAIDGVSLTLAKVEGETVFVALIPHTVENTTLGALVEGQKVNIETDILGRYVRQMLDKE